MLEVDNLYRLFRAACVRRGLPRRVGGASRSRHRDRARLQVYAAVRNRPIGLSPWLLQPQRVVFRDG